MLPLTGAIWYLLLYKLTFWALVTKYPNGVMPPDVKRTIDGWAPAWVCLITPGIAFLISWGITATIVNLAAAAERQRIAAQQQRDREAASRQAAIDEAERRRKQAEADTTRLAAERARALAQIAELVTTAQHAVARLPIILAKAELALDRAEQELADNVPSSFWEAMETSVQHLGDFDSTTRSIEAARSRHASLAPPLKPQAVDFRLGVSLLPDAAHTASRMNNLYRQAQRKTEGNFAIIYEQRRNTATLIQGFKSLGEAFTHLGDRLEAALGSLGDQLDFRLTDIESALRDSAESMHEQQSALLQVAEEARREAATANAEQAQIALAAASHAEQDARSKRQFEADARGMLDNIQRRRKPIPPGIGDNTY